ncbi:hypothetical protein AYO21_09142 [Fonsecaea monophora]|uniref:Uncharacterized protein n=1 Tax=Fonsecaea monophora TaxID=254056 RepID=A0A177EX88_9EURO|nr:hypothetical protein AYO21_09142 [Fonsecaea monophora]OAG36667.1 hypothetical protein AYO21_09142 [Fonsecaea monophora]
MVYQHHHVCRATTGVWIVRKNVSTNITPCSKRTEEGSAITLFAPTECVKRQTIMVSYQPDCVGANMTMTASTMHKDHQDGVKEAILKMAFNINLTVYLAIPGDDNKVPWLRLDLINGERTQTIGDTTL